MKLSLLKTEQTMEKDTDWHCKSIRGNGPSSKPETHGCFLVNLIPLGVPNSFPFSHALVQKHLYVIRKAKMSFLMHQMRILEVVAAS